MILIIDTIGDNKFAVALASSSGILVDQQKYYGQYIQAEKLLPGIEKILKKNKINIEKLTGIVVVKGPGGFTSIRIGVTTANALAYALNKPVVGLKSDENLSLKELAVRGIKLLKNNGFQSLIVPFYGREPNITKPKKK